MREPITQEAPQVFAPNGLTLVSLFAGAGGSCCGYRAAGYDIRLAVEWNADAAACYRVNFPTTPVYEGNIADLSDAEALRLARVNPGELDVLDGSPPCQGFSMAGKREITDARNTLFHQYLRLLRAFRPRALIMENVSGLRKGKMRLVFAEIHLALKAAGYRVSCRELNAWWYGVPQDRRRLIWIGLREDLDQTPQHPTPSHREPITIGQALGPSAACVTVNRDFQETWRTERPSPTLGLMRLPRGAPALMTHRAWGTNRDHSTINKGWRSGPAHTIGTFRQPFISDADIFAPRPITAAEAKILQGFPDSFTMAAASEALAFQFIGNSVAPPMAEAVGRRVAESLA